MLDQNLIKIFSAIEIILYVLKLLIYVAVLIIETFRTLMHSQTLCLSLDGNLNFLLSYSCASRYLPQSRILRF